MSLLIVSPCVSFWIRLYFGHIGVCMSFGCTFDL